MAPSFRLFNILTLCIASVSNAADALGTTQDMGPKTATDTKSVTLVLGLHNRPELEAFIASATTPHSPNYHQFLSVAAFTARYGATPAEVAQVTASLAASGLSVSSVTPNRLALKVSGTVRQINAFFSTELHNYRDTDGTVYHAPAGRFHLPASIAGTVVGVHGLTTQKLFHNRIKRDPERISDAPVALTANTTATGLPGQYTVGDVSRLYQVNPLYQAGLHGEGRTLGIVTLASFAQSDAYLYWSAFKVPAKANRITEVVVDPADGPVTTDGADETTLDVQQAGGLAPSADIVVYEAPNAGSGFIDAFIQAVVENKVDTLSTSWGSAEIFNDPTSFDQVLLAAAAQGISVFAASGDAGAYDVGRGISPLPYFPCTNALTVDYPASSPFITAAGGLTLPGTQTRRKGTVTVPNLRPWGWNYLENYLYTNYPDQGLYYGAGYFPVGGGGGVSLLEPLPRYQKHLKGVVKSSPSQNLSCVDNTGAIADYTNGDLPAGFAGRNVPDISLNADPNTGYLLVFGGALYAGSGGTSFVAPQLNGIFALIAQGLGGRVGLVNFPAYRLARRSSSFGVGGPFVDVKSDDNLFYQAGKGYDAASGIGAINAANLLNALQSDDGYEADTGDDD